MARTIIDKIKSTWDCVKPVLAWYDMWVGAYWDKKKRLLYILPIPCVGIVLGKGRPELEVRPSVEVFDPKSADYVKIRPSVWSFAIAMEKELRENDHKGGWSDLSLDELAERMNEEIDEVLWAVKHGNVDHIQREIVDVGKYAMMMFDNSRDSVDKGR